MIVGIYTVRDEKAGYYGTPFYSHNDSTAIRQLSDLRADNNSPLGKHPEDFRLYRLGTYDDQTAQVTLDTITYIQEPTT